MEFERQNERMEMTSDMMGDAMDDAMEVGRGGGGRGLGLGGSGVREAGRRGGGGGAAAAGRRGRGVGVGCSAGRGGPQTLLRGARAGLARPRLGLGRRQRAATCRPHSSTHRPPPPLAPQGEGEAEETDELVSQVLDEIGINLTNSVGARRPYPRARCRWAGRTPRVRARVHLRPPPQRPLGACLHPRGSAPGRSPSLTSPSLLLPSDGQRARHARRRAGCGSTHGGDGGGAHGRRQRRARRRRRRGPQQWPRRRRRRRRRRWRQRHR
jgi:hypothetical protein